MAMRLGERRHGDNADIEGISQEAVGSVAPPVIAIVLPGARGRAGTTNGTAFSSTVPGGSVLSMSKRLIEPSG